MNCALASVFVPTVDFALDSALAPVLVLDVHVSSLVPASARKASAAPAAFAYVDEVPAAALAIVSTRVFVPVPDPALFCR